MRIQPESILSLLERFNVTDPSVNFYTKKSAFHPIIPTVINHAEARSPKEKRAIRERLAIFPYKQAFGAFTDQLNAHGYHVFPMYNKSETGSNYRVIFESIDGQSGPKVVDVFINKSKKIKPKILISERDKHGNVRMRKLSRSAKIGKIEKQFLKEPSSFTRAVNRSNILFLSKLWIAQRYADPLEQSEIQDFIPMKNN